MLSVWAEIFVWSSCESNAPLVAFERVRFFAVPVLTVTEKKPPPFNHRHTATVPVAYLRTHREEQRAASLSWEIPIRCEGAPFALCSFVDVTSSRPNNFGSIIFYLSSLSFFVPIYSNFPLLSFTSTCYLQLRSYADNFIFVRFVVRRIL